MVRHDGGGMIAMGAGLGFIVSVYNFLSPRGLLAPLSDVSGTPGAIVAIAATASLFVAGLMLAGSLRHPALIAFLIVGSFVGILGTGLAAWLLDSQLLLGLMGLAFVGWLLRVFTGPAAQSRRT